MKPACASVTNLPVNSLPYIGVVRERAFGGTADFRRAEGEDIDDTRIVGSMYLVPISYFCTCK